MSSSTKNSGGGGAAAAAAAAAAGGNSFSTTAGKTPPNAIPKEPSDKPASSSQKNADPSMSSVFLNGKTTFDHALRDTEALSYLHKQQYQNAYIAWTDLIERQGDKDLLVYYYVGRACALDGLEQYESAERDARHAVQLDNELPDTHTVLGRILYHRRDYSSAAKCCQHSLDVDNNPRKNPHAYRWRARIAWGNRDHRLAMYMLCSLGNTDPSVQDEKGQVLCEMGRPSEAICALDAGLRCPQATPDQTAHLYFTRGNALVLLQQLGQASEALEKALQVDSVSLSLRGTVRVELGHIQYRMGRRQDALASFEKTLEDTPENVLALHNLAGLLLEDRTTFEKPSEVLSRAANHARRAIELAPKDLDCRVLYAEILLAQEKYDQVIEQCDIVLPENASYYEAYCHKAEAQYFQGNGYDALDTYANLLREYPGDTHAEQRYSSINFEYPK